MTDHITRAGWQCPQCKTVYSPDVRACRCAALRRSLSPWPRITHIPGGAPRSVTAGCTCPSAWGGLTPPPACPAHGQTEMYQVRC